MSTEEEAAAVAASPSAEGGGGGKKNNKDNKNKKDERPIEELYDLSKPIPKVKSNIVERGRAVLLCVVNLTNCSSRHSLSRYDLPSCYLSQVPKPNKEEHDKQLNEIEVVLNSIKESRQKVQSKIDEALNANKNSAIGKEREELQKLRNQKNALIEEKKAIRAKLDQAKNQADKIMKDKKDAKSNIKFTNVADIDKEIAKLQRIQETTSMSLNEEKKLIKEMDALKNSKAIVAQLKDKDAAMDGVKNERKAIGAMIAAKDKEIDAVQKLMDDKMTIIKGMSEKATDKRDTLNTLFKERDELRQKFTDKLKEKDAVRAEYREKNNVWYNYQRAVRAQKKIQYEEEKKKRDEEHAEYLKKVEEEEAKKIPYEEEQALCDYLADYLTKTYLSDDKTGSAGGDEKKAADVVVVKDDPFAGMKAMSKKDDDEVYFGKGKGKKKRDRTNKKQDQKNAGPFTLSVDTFEQFGWLGLTPPTSLDMVEGSVKELREKKVWYSQQPRGSVPTANEIRKANEKAAQKLRQNNGDATGGAKTTKSPGKGSGGGKFSLSNDDFVPLSGSSGTGGGGAVLSSWGSKPAGNAAGAPPAAGGDPTPTEAAAS